MSLVIGQEQKKIEVPRIGEGTFPARVVSVVDMGVQYETDWQTQEVKKDDDGNKVTAPKVFITFELPTEMIEIDGEDKPRWMGKEYKLSFHEKSNLMAIIKAVNPSAKTLADLLDKPCMVTIGTTATGKDKIVGVTSPVKGMVVDDLQNETVMFDFDEPRLDDWAKVPEFIKKKIKEAVNFSGSEVEDMLQEDF